MITLATFDKYLYIKENFKFYSYCYTGGFYGHETTLRDGTTCYVINFWTGMVDNEALKHGHKK